jgi:hypothetical protein
MKKYLPNYFILEFGMGGGKEIITLQIWEILLGKDGKKNDYLIGFISLRKSIQML